MSSTDRMVLLLSDAREVRDEVLTALRTGGVPCVALGGKLSEAGELLSSCDDYGRRTPELALIVADAADEAVACVRDLRAHDPLRVLPIVVLGRSCDPGFYECIRHGANAVTPCEHEGGTVSAARATADFWLRHNLRPKEA